MFEQQSRRQYSYFKLYCFDEHEKSFKIKYNKRHRNTRVVIDL